MKFDQAKVVLRDAAFKIGSELFTREALLQIGQIQADAGVESAKKELELAKFVETLFDSKSTQEKKNEDFWELISAIGILGEYQRHHNQPLDSDTKSNGD